jgi:hypothetical protein
MNKKDVETVEPESAEFGFVSELKWIGDCQLSQEAEERERRAETEEREREGPRR